MTGQSFIELKNKLLTDIYNNKNIIKSLVMHGENFLDVIPTEDEQYFIDNPEQLLRKQIFPYRMISLNNAAKIPYLTMTFFNFRKVKKNFIFGSITFLMIVPIALDKTSYGQRYDVIADMLEDTLSETGIGVFEFKGRSDTDLGTTEFQGHSITFDITDFHWKD